MSQDGKEPVQPLNLGSIEPLPPQILDRFQHLLRLQYLLTVGPAVVFTSKPSDNYAATYVSDNIRAITGYKPDNFLSDPDFWVNHVHPDDLPRIFAGLEQLGTQDLLRHEYRFLHQDGQYRWMMNELRLIRDDSGEPIEIVGFLSDISDRKQAEAALHQSESRYRAIVEDQTELIARFLPDSTILYVNEAYCRFFGVERQDVVGHSYQPVIYEADRDRVNELIQSMNAANPTVIIENRVLNGAGEVRWTQWINRMLFDDNGELMEIQAVGRDITELKQIEEALRQSEERWQFALEGSGDGVWDWDLSSNTLFYSSRWKEMLGYDDSEIGNSLSEWSDRIHPDDRDSVLAATDELLRGEIQQYSQEYRFRHKDGFYLWILDRGRVVSHTPEGEPLRVIGTHSDITALKQAEAELRRSQISRSLVGEMLRDLQVRGNLSETAMFQAGQELAGRIHSKTLEQFLDAFASMGLGTLALAETKSNRWTFTGDKLVSFKPGQDQPTCHYPRGYLCGAIAQITQTPGQIAAVEMECQAMGDPLCKFVVQVMH